MLCDMSDNNSARENPQAAGEPSKSELRHRALALRKRTTSHERLIAGRALVRELPELTVRPHMTVAAYVSMGTEIETRPLIAWLLTQDCTVLVPRLGSGLDIGWSVVRSLDDLQEVSGTGHLRPDEPSSDVLPPDALKQADVVIAPALGVDSQGVRLGRGAGWYDRALAARRQDCLLIAVCWPWEVTDGRLPAQPHDVPADAVLTPAGYRRLRRRTGA